MSRLSSVLRTEFVSVTPNAVFIGCLCSCKHLLLACRLQKSDAMKTPGLPRGRTRRELVAAGYECHRPRVHRPSSSTPDLFPTTETAFATANLLSRQLPGHYVALPRSYFGNYRQHS